MSDTETLTAKAILDSVLDDENARPVVCRHCGTHGLRIDNQTVVNPGPGEVLTHCLTRPPLGKEFPLPHGPWDRVV